MKKKTLFEMKLVYIYIYVSLAKKKKKKKRKKISSVKNACMYVCMYIDCLSIIIF